MLAVFQRSKSRFQGRPCWVVGARIFEPLVIAHAILDIGGGQIHWSHDCSRCGIRFDTCMHSKGAAAWSVGLVAHCCRKLRQDYFLRDVV